MPDFTTEQKYFNALFWIHTVLLTEWKHGDDPEEACRRILEIVERHLDQFDTHNG